MRLLVKNRIPTEQELLEDELVAQMVARAREEGKNEGIKQATDLFVKQTMEKKTSINRKIFDK